MFSIIKVTDYEVRTDIIDTVNVALPVPSMFKMLSLIYCLIYMMVAIKYSLQL